MKNKNGGFSLVEMLVAFAVLAALAAMLVPSFIASSQHADQEKDSSKFESICTAFKKATAEPEVKKEMERLAGGGDVLIIGKFDEDGVLDIPESQIVGLERVALGDSKLWLNSYQSIGEEYESESDGLEKMYITFYLQPKTAVSNSSCEYSITEKSPEAQRCTIQVASVSNSTSADDIVAQLNQAGYQATTGVSDGKYNVYVGEFSSIQSAKKTETQLIKLGYGTKIKTI